MVDPFEMGDFGMAATPQDIENAIGLLDKRILEMKVGVNTLITRIIWYLLITFKLLVVNILVCCLFRMDSVVESALAMKTSHWRASIR